MNSIKFNQQGIEAILNGSKTMTRRPIELKNGFCESDKYVMYALDHIEKSKRGAIHREIYDKELGLTKFTGEITHPKYKVGEIVKAFIEPPKILEYTLEWEERYSTEIKITNIKVERLQDISEEDCIKEGVVEVPFRPDDGWPMCIGYMGYKDDGKTSLPYEAIKAFERDVWNDLPYKAPNDWNSNPYCFCYTFEVVK